MSEKICVECGRFFDPPKGSSRVTCDDECKAERLRTRQTSISSRFIALQRILRDEKIYWRDDRLIHSERFYEGLLSWGCLYCGVGLADFSGVCLDRISSDSKHNSWSVCPACPLCNRCKSSEGESGFSFEEMGQVIGPAVARVRTRREKQGK